MSRCSTEERAQTRGDKLKNECYSADWNLGHGGPQRIVELRVDILCERLADAACQIAHNP